MSEYLSHTWAMTAGRMMTSVSNLCWWKTLT